jgi:serine/threonine protein kinase
MSAVRDFWTKNERPYLTQTLVKDVMIQLQGIIGALKMIHEKGFRHGDLKPENIVRQEFPPHGSSPSRLDVGELKICDMGLTKYYIEATEFRNRSTDT